ncbi:winged helix-turn-helix transcriptional regulator [Anaerosporobacter sp.]|uniref:winged helix-turn-helix transcriptional regulator n=1 Tax=Anaerosporobacter sp. TaxID=1872529 RepID=UPI00286F6B17|nr:helix-turn-helix domain-containing protein [Anaerosporobacter sp.]
MNKSNDNEEILCPCLVAQRLMQGKWAIIIMYYLSNGPIRFNELQRQMPKMTHATLSNQLKQLESEGLIIRTEYAQIPPKVEYKLSDIGKEFQPVLDSINLWGQKYIEYMKCK